MSTIRSRPSPLAASAIALVALAVVLVACSTASGRLDVQDAYVRVTAPSAPAAAYLVIVNSTTSSDALIGASSPSFATVELHETSVMDAATPGASGGGMSMTGMSPAPSSGAGDTMVGMAEVKEIPVPAGGRQELKPGAYHLMLMDPTGPIMVGQTVDLTLTFRTAGKLMVKATVRGA